MEFKKMVEIVENLNGLENEPHFRNRLKKYISMQTH